MVSGTPEAKIGQIQTPQRLFRLIRSSQSLQFQVIRSDIQGDVSIVRTLEMNTGDQKNYAPNVLYFGNDD